MSVSSSTETVDIPWSSLYKIGGTAALLAALVFRRNLGAELTLLATFGIIHDIPTQPLNNAIEWFNLFQDKPIVGLTLLNVFDLVEYSLVALILLALYGALRRVNKSAMVIATTSGLVGITVYFASNQAFAMLALSERYASATTDIQRSTYLAAGEALLAMNKPDAIYQGTGIYVSLFLVLLAGLMISLVMWTSNVFSKTTAIMGILANGIGLCYFITLAFTPAIFWIPIPISAPFRVVWYILIGIRLFKLGNAHYWGFSD